MNLKELEIKLNNIYTPEKFHDAIPSGLIIEGKSSISKGGITGVSFCTELVGKAIEVGADFIVVHHAHGFWNNQPRTISGGFKVNIYNMLNNGISLFGYHLPMDMHPSMGNNILLLKELGLNQCCSSHENIIVGELDDEIPFSEFIELVTKKIGVPNFSFNHGNEKIKKVAICSGGGASLIREAKKTGADVFLTGEAKEDTQIFCKDEQFNFVAAGHHNTEKLGLMKLTDYLVIAMGIPTEFINIPNLL